MDTYGLCKPPDDGHLPGSTGGKGPHKDVPARRGGHQGMLLPWHLTYHPLSNTYFGEMQCPALSPLWWQRGRRVMPSVPGTGTVTLTGVGRPPALEPAPSSSASPPQVGWSCQRCHHTRTH